MVNNVADEHASSVEENGQHKTEHQLRLKRLDFDDPVRTVCLKEFLQNQVSVFFLYNFFYINVCYNS